MRKRLRTALASMLAVLGLYSAAFLWWSHRESDGPVWSFYRPPGGLMSVELAIRLYRHETGTAPPGDPDPRNEWRQRERRLELTFYPCIWLDQRISGREYWPRSKRTKCFG